MINETPELKRMSRTLEETDPEVAEALRDEVRRQATGLELIASDRDRRAPTLAELESTLPFEYHVHA